MCQWPLVCQSSSEHNFQRSKVLHYVKHHQVGGKAAYGFWADLIGTLVDMG